MSTTLQYFRWPLLLTLVGILLGGWIGWEYTGKLDGVILYGFLCAVLAVLEISLSFDNAIVNANTLKGMNAVWRRRFLTWGILIAVFGMRILFPIAIVCIAAQIDPVSALRLAINDPAGYAAIMDGAHLSIVAFGGTFLMMVGLGFFFDADKDVHWVRVIEQRVARLGVVGVDAFITMLVVMVFVAILPEDERLTFLMSAVYGLLAFLGVKLVGSLLDGGGGEDHGSSAGNAAVAVVAKGGLGAFLYLEVLDASFSFDGVIGAFAISQICSSSRLGLASARSTSVR